LLLAVSVFTSCTSYTQIQSNPSGADVYIDGQFAGKTPLMYSDTKFMLSETFIDIKRVLNAEIE